MNLEQPWTWPLAVQVARARGCTPRYVEEDDFRAWYCDHEGEHAYGRLVVYYERLREGAAFQPPYKSDTWTSKPAGNLLFHEAVEAGVQVQVSKSEHNRLYFVWFDEYAQKGETYGVAMAWAYVEWMNSRKAKQPAVEDKATATLRRLIQLPHSMDMTSLKEKDGVVVTGYIVDIDTLARTVELQHPDWLGSAIVRIDAIVDIQAIPR